MGSGTFVDGVLRWFHHHNRRSSSTPNPDGQVNLDSETKSLPSSSSSSNQLTVTEDFDYSALKAIRVPKRINFPPACPSPSVPMDHKKKVSFLHLSLSPDLLLLISIMSCAALLHVNLDQ